MSAMTVLSAMAFTFGCVGALSPLQFFPDDLPTADRARIASLDTLKPLLARCARGALLMTIALVALLYDSGTMLAAPLCIALIALGHVVIATFRLRLTDAGTQLIRVRRSVGVAARATLGAGLVAFVQAMVQRADIGFFLLTASAFLLVAARVQFVIKGAAKDLLLLSGD